MAATKSRKKRLDGGDEPDTMTTDKEVKVKWAKPTTLIRNLQRIRNDMEPSWYGDIEATNDQQVLDQVINLLKGADDGKSRRRKRA